MRYSEEDENVRVGYTSPNVDFTSIVHGTSSVISDTLTHIHVSSTTPK